MPQRIDLVPLNLLHHLTIISILSLKLLRSFGMYGAGHYLPRLPLSILLRTSIIFCVFRHVLVTVGQTNVALDVINLAFLRFLTTNTDASRWNVWCLGSSEINLFVYIRSHVILMKTDFYQVGAFSLCLFSPQINESDYPERLYWRYAEQKKFKLKKHLNHAYNCPSHWKRKLPNRKFYKKGWLLENMLNEES